MASEMIERSIRSVVKKTYRQWQDANPQVKRLIKKSGGLRSVVDTDTRAIVKTPHQMMFARHEIDDEPNFLTPYFFSFCVHGEDQEYEQLNGLLSQWRGYGGNDENSKEHSGGIAIVFDYKRLKE